MRVQYESKMFTLKDYDHAKNRYTMLDGSIIKRKDIQAMILMPNEAKEVFDKVAKAKKVVEVAEVVDVAEVAEY